MRRLLLIAISLAALDVAVFARVGGFESVLLDDDIHVFKNPHVREGLNRDSVLLAPRALGTGARAVGVSPDYHEAHDRLAEACFRLGLDDEGRFHRAEAERLRRGANGL